LVNTADICHLTASRGWGAQAPFFKEKLGKEVQILFFPRYKLKPSINITGGKTE
jgi:hypothetical protein